MPGNFSSSSLLLRRSEFSGAGFSSEVFSAFSRNSVLASWACLRVLCARAVCLRVLLSCSQWETGRLQRRQRLQVRRLQRIQVRRVQRVQVQRPQSRSKWYVQEGGHLSLPLSLE